MSQMSKQEIEEENRLLLDENRALGERLDRAEASLAMYREYVGMLEKIRDAQAAELARLTGHRPAAQPRPALGPVGGGR